MRILITHILCFAMLLTAQSPPRERYAEAIKALNEGRPNDGKALLEKLLADHPDYYRGYSVFWRAVGLTQNSETRKTTVERDLKLFEQAPTEKRDEDFYNNFRAGYQILQDNRRVAEVDAECINKFPRGLLAQSKRLDAAKASQQDDPIKSAALYAAYMKEFEENVSWVQLAAANRFRIVRDHPDQFDLRLLASAAEETEYRSRQFIGKFGNPASHFGQMIEIVNALVERDPEMTLNYARRGIAFVQEQWPKTDQIKDSSRIAFWPLMIRAHLALKEWKPAATIAEALVRELEADKTSRPLLSEKEEVTVRLNYATALENIGALELARVQREVADNPGRNREQRERQVREALLARRQQRIAPPFTLRDLAGKTVTLEQFRDRTVVLIFWATWCGPCIGELDELKTLYDRYKQDPSVALVTISTDADKELVPKLAAERGYTFPILHSDGSIEEPYRTQSIPQLYVIDRAGRIRFHESGYSRDGFYARKLDWMIDFAKE
jgi:peroxiredoxin